MLNGGRDLRRPLSVSHSCVWPHRWALWQTALFKDPVRTALWTLHLGYKNQPVYAVSGTSRFLFSDKYKTHKYSVGREYSCWMLNCWCITWPVGFKRLIHKGSVVNLNSYDFPLPWILLYFPVKYGEGFIYFLEHFLWNYQNTRNVPTWAIISCFILIYKSSCFILLMMPIVVWQAFVLIQWVLAYLATLSLYVFLYYYVTGWLLLQRDGTKWNRSINRVC